MSFSIPEILSLVDLTSLNEDDSVSSIAAFCLGAEQSFGHVAAVCIYPQFVAQARAAVAEKIAVATVVNFPTGLESPETVFTQTRQAIADGANEVDLVFPYRIFVDGNTSAAETLTTEVAKICHEHGVLLKVILETGALSDEEITSAAECAVRAGADFLKTSTGKIAHGASLKAATLLLEVIKKSARPVGLKISGGVRDVKTALTYLEQAEKMMGRDWITPEHFRLGASSLLDDLKKHL